MTSEHEPQRTQAQKFQLLESPSQIYTGGTLLNNLHGSGVYFTEKPDGKVYIDGLFYCNKLEGYGQVYYEDGSFFQGLFKNNKRFGPGVLTYANGHQDVGVWKGFSLVRLGSVVDELHVPKLAETDAVLAYLRRFKHVLPLGPPGGLGVVAEMLRAFAADGVLVEHAKDFYSSCVRNQNNLFFNTTLFNAAFFSDPQPEDLTVLEEELEVITTNLASLQEKLPILSERIEYCKACCQQPEKLESRKSSQKTASDIINASLGHLVLNADDTKSTMTETITFDDAMSFAISESIASASEAEEDIPQDKCVCEEEMEVEDLGLLEEQYAELVRAERFYSNIQRGLQERLAAASSEPAVEADETRKVFAFNNEKLMLEVLEHSILHRKFQSRVQVKLSAIFDGERPLEFSHGGQHETDCEQFLFQSGSGNLPTVLEHLRKPNIDVNLMDANGNTAVFFAALKHSKEIIRVLVNFGANLNQLNDEGLTPLNMSILSYLAERNNIESWETSFLPQDPLGLDEEDVIDWHPGATKQKRTTEASQLLKRDTVTKTYFFDSKYNDPNTTRLGSSGSGSAIKMYPDHSTITNLLKFGANPNIGVVPLPALILSMYSENPSIVEELLEYGADICVKKPQENLTCLHIIASLECNDNNVKICSLLLASGCDPNVKTDGEHWPEQMVRLLGNCQLPEEFQDVGKNPLHILCMRRDSRADRGNSFKEMAELFIESKVRFSDTYLGLNALELAVISNNASLVEFILGTGLLDPYRLIEPSVGNTLTLFISERFKNCLPLEECKEVLELLVSLGVNPLHPVGNHDNVVDFMERPDPTTKAKKKEPPRRGDNTQATLRNLLKNSTRKLLLADIGAKATKQLYDLAEAGGLGNEGVEVLARYLTPKLVVDNLRLIFELEEVPLGRFHVDTCQRVLEFVREHGKQPKASKKRTTTRGIKFEAQAGAPASFDFDSMRKALSVRKPPGGGVSYEVCFQCLKSNGGSLTKCTRCGLLQFCSTQCNQLNLKQKNNDHVCASNVFDLAAAAGGLAELCNAADVTCQKNYAERKRQQRELQRQKEREERRLDVYGRKFLHKTAASAAKAVAEDSFGDDGYYESDKYECSSHFIIPSILAPRFEENRASDGSRIRDPISFTLNETLQKLSSFRDARETQTNKKKLVAETVRAKKLGPERVRKVKKLKKVQKVNRETCGMINCKVAEGGEKFGSPFEVLPNLEEPYIIRRKTLREPPEKMRFFIELLKKYFPNVDMSFLIIPYICYADGHLFYQFSDKITSKNYSLS